MREMAFIGLKVPHEVARLLADTEFVKYGEPVSPDTFHVTIAVLEDNVPIEELARAIAPVFEVASNTRPFSVSTNHVDHFGDPEKTEFPIIALIDSFELHALRDRLLRVLNKAKIEYSKKFPEYRPHVTLGYGKDLAALDYIPMHIPSTITWGAQELVLWGGDKGDNRVIVTFPFSLGLNAKAAHRTDPMEIVRRGFVRLSMYAGRPTWPRRDAISTMVAERFRGVL